MKALNRGMINDVSNKCDRIAEHILEFLATETADAPMGISACAQVIGILAARSGASVDKIQGIACGVIEMYHDIEAMSPQEGN